MTALVDRYKADTEQTTKPVHAPVPVAAAPGFWDRKPKLVGDTQPVNHLEHQFEIQAELHLDDDEPRPRAAQHRNDVAALDLPFTSNPLACRKRLMIG